MADQKIEPHRITKPIQLLGAWLAGLAIINSSFLVGAATVKTPTWIPALLAIAAVGNVPLFILSLFLLQTKFRPEMQEDIFYSQYLERRYVAPKPETPPVDIEKNIEMVARRILSDVPKSEQDNTVRLMEILKESEIDHLQARFALSRSLSELHLHPEGWQELVGTWKGDPSFKDDIEELKSAGLATFPSNKWLQAQLTDIGKAVAQKLEEQHKLWNQKHNRHIGPRAD